MNKNRTAIIGGFLLLIGFSASAQYLLTDGSNSMSGNLNIIKENYASIELKSNTGSFIDFHSTITSDYDGRIIWNYSGSNRFDIYGGIKFHNSATFSGNIESSGTSFIFNSSSQPNATIWLTKPNSGPSTQGHYYIKAFDWWGSNLHFQGTGDNGNEKMNVTIDGSLGVGVTQNQAKLHIHDSELLGSNASDSKLLSRLSGRSSNTVMSNLWLLRDATGTNWFTARLHDGISVDNSYMNPGSNTRTWWERDPYNNIQEWGNGSATYMTIKSGNVGIGTTNPTEKLTVKGTVHAEEVKVDLSVPGPDYVFEPDYNLRTLEETAAYIKTNKHLPEIPSAKEMEANGVQLGEMNMLLLKKIEELTLHLIEVNKENGNLRQQLEANSKELNANSQKLIEQGMLLEELRKKVEGQ